jgi:hypothetical protein
MPEKMYGSAPGSWIFLNTCQRDALSVHTDGWYFVRLEAKNTTLIGEE